MALRNKDKAIADMMADGKVGAPTSADYTQAAYFENLGYRRGLGYCADLYTLLDDNFEIEKGPEQDEEEGTRNEF